MRKGKSEEINFICLLRVDRFAVLEFRIWIGMGVLISVLGVTFVGMRSALRS